MIDYIYPQINKYQTIDELLENHNRFDYIYDNKDCLSIEKLLQDDFICIVGEPGIGKSRLVKELERMYSKDVYSCIASKFKIDSIPEGITYCVIDALDEVDGSNFYTTLKSIMDYKAINPKIKVLFTCRKHYVESYAETFISYNNLIYIELCRLTELKVIEVVKNCSPETQAYINKNPKLKELLTIPRYLLFLLEYENEKKKCSNIRELFEYFISRSIHNAINSHKDIVKNESIKIIIQRVLEKVAFIMEISRKDQISKDELYSILDEVKGNMTQMLITNFDVLFFENRILKETNGTLQFENTEFQEYLAAKELCRQSNIESVLYDVAVQKELKHIYPNWYDVIPHISYNEDQAHTFINVLKLIVSYESNLENESFESLLRLVDSSTIIPSQKEELFTILFDHYLRLPAYIKWKSSTLKLIQDCYSSNCNDKLKVSFEQFNKIQLSNITTILEEISEGHKLDKSVAVFWVEKAKSLISQDDKEMQLAALNLFYALHDEFELIHLSSSYHFFSKEVKEKYCEVTGYRRITNKDVVNCWIESCYVSNPYAINAVLCIDDLSTMLYAYNKIIEVNKLHDFFDQVGALVVNYDLYLAKQFSIAWNKDQDSKRLFTKIIACFVEMRAYASHNDIFYIIIKKILLTKETGLLFILRFNENKGNLDSLFRSFNAEYVDAELLSALNTIFHEIKMDKYWVDCILTSLINKIRNNEGKKASISEYISRYADTFSQWDKIAAENAEKRFNNPLFNKDYQSLSDPTVSVYVKYEIAYRLSNNIELLKLQNHQPIIEVIESFFDSVDLDKLIFEKKGDNSYRLSRSLAIIPCYLKILYHLGELQPLKKHRDIIIKTLPIASFTTNQDADVIKSSYKSLIGGISDIEKSEFVEWWKSRKDDFMNISPKGVFSCITEFGIEALSYKLDEYVNDYIKQQDLSHFYAASNALDLISEGYLNWDVEKYKVLFNNLEDDDIDSIKMQCNTIMIEKYQDKDAITWRIEYFKKHVVKSLNYDTGHARAISTAESEMISSKPRMFRCFMGIKGNDMLVEQMYGLFEYGLSLYVKTDTQEYASYLLRQIYLFFINTTDVNCFSELRKKVEGFNATNVNYLANNIMNNAEMQYLTKDIITIRKAIKLYNQCIEQSYLDIRNDGDLRRFFTQIYSEVQKEIQDQGIYSLVQLDNLNEDFIQRELKNTIINKCCQMGLMTVRVDREVALQDNKRTDLLIRYGLCNPIMVELKLLHNREIQNKKKRQEYKTKFIQYTKATNACLSVFWVFNVHKNGSNDKKFKELEMEYQNLSNTTVLLTDCKCSSAFENV